MLMMKFKDSGLNFATFFKVFWGDAWMGTFFQKRASPQILFLKYYRLFMLLLFMQTTFLYGFGLLRLPQMRERQESFWMSVRADCLKGEGLQDLGNSEDCLKLTGLRVSYEHLNATEFGSGLTLNPF